MKKRFGDYTYLAGGGRLRGSVWEGKDHLLCVEPSGFLFSLKESYRRIDFSKIQAVSYASTTERLRNFAKHCALLLLGGWWLASPSIRLSDSVLGFWKRFARLMFPDVDYVTGLTSMGVILVVLALLLLIINIIKGRTCVCTLQTAVQTLILKGVDRERQAKPLVEKLVAHCLAHQGNRAITSEVISELDRLPPPPAFLKVKEAYTRTPVIESALLLMLISGGLMLGEFYVDSVTYLWADLILILVAGAFVMSAGARSSRMEISTGLRRALRGGIRTFGFGVLLTGILVVTASEQTMLQAARTGRLDITDATHELDMVKWLAHASFPELRGLANLVVLLGVFNVVLAILGLLSIRKYMVSAVPPPLPAKIPSVPPPLPTLPNAEP